jgi:hypothetical protein
MLLSRLQACAPACGAWACRPRWKTRPRSPAFLAPDPCGGSCRPIRARIRTFPCWTPTPPPGPAAAAAMRSRQFWQRGQAPPHHADLPQHPRPGRDLLSRRCGYGKRRPAHRHPPRLPVARTARAGGTGDGGGRLARRRLHRLALISGIDWGDVDLVIQVGAPKNVKRLVQRIGRANHRYNAPSKALLVPANRFEVVECQAALDAVRDHDAGRRAARPRAARRAVPAYPADRLRRPLSTPMRFMPKSFPPDPIPG